MKKILITGGNGFVGKNFIKYLKKKKKNHIIPIPRSIDLRSNSKVNKYFKNIGKASYIFHFAEVSGNKEWSKKNSFKQTLMNLKININVISAWKKYQPEAKFIFLSSIWSYPIGNSYLLEKDYWKGEINKELLHFAYNKRIATILLETAKRNLNLKATTLILGTVYGPGDLSDHFIPTIIRRMRNEKNYLRVYGTGKESRDFIYVDDQVKGIYMSKDYNGEILNIGTGKLTTIKKIIQISKKLIRYKGKIEYMKFNKSPDKNRGMSIKNAKKFIGWSKKNKFVNIEKGLKNTIQDMLENE